jgi:hypothetical protein
MSRASIALVAVLLLLSPGEASGQTSDTSSFLEQAGALQSKLNGWQQVLSNMNLGLLPLNAGQRQLLERERSACLELFGSLNSEITALQSKITPEGEVRIDFDVTRLSGRLFSLHDSLNALNSLALRSGNLALTHSVLVQVGEIGSMVSGLQGLDQFRVMRELDALGTSGTPAQPKPQQPGEISGHVYRADSGKALAGVKVMLGLVSSFGPPFRLVQTAEDGSYRFSNVPPESYRRGAY